MGCSLPLILAYKAFYPWTDPHQKSAKLKGTFEAQDCQEIPFSFVGTKVEQSFRQSQYFQDIVMSRKVSKI